MGDEFRIEGFAVEADALADRDQFMRRLVRIFASSAADVNTELSFERGKAALERANSWW